mgnify:FL=1
MAESENKVQFGLKNVHYAPMAGDGTYSTPVAIPGAVSLSLKEDSSVNKFYADNVLYYVSNTGNGYSGDLEMARFIDQMLVDIWGFVEHSTDHTLVEYADKNPATFALLFEIDGDATAAKYVIYAVTAGKPDIGGETKGESTEPKTQSCTVNTQPLADGKLSARTTKSTPKSVLESWYTKVYLPAAEDLG